MSHATPDIHSSGRGGRLGCPRTSLPWAKCSTEAPTVLTHALAEIKSTLRDGLPFAAASRLLVIVNGGIQSCDSGSGEVSTQPRLGTNSKEKVRTQTKAGPERHTLREPSSPRLWERARAIASKVRSESDAMGCLAKFQDNADFYRALGTMLNKKFPREAETPTDLTRRAALRATGLRLTFENVSNDNHADTLEFYHLMRCVSPKLTIIMAKYLEQVDLTPDSVFSLLRMEPLPPSEVKTDGWLPPCPLCNV